MTTVEEIRQLRAKGLFQREIAAQVGVSQSYVSTVLNNNKRGSRLKLQDDLRHNCFSIQSPESDFWAGYIAADGCVVGNRIQLGCQKSDEEFLTKFASWCDSNHKISYGLSKKSNTWSSQLAFKSEQMIADLEEFYNIKPKKSLTQISPNRTSMNFVAGLWMGDGHISWNSSRQHYTCGFCGTKEMMEWVKTYFEDITKASVTPTSNIYEFCVAGRNNTMKTLHRIFEHSPFVLDRKYQRYKDALIREEVRCG